MTTEGCCFPDKFPPSKISLSIQEPKILPFSQKQKFKNRNPKPPSFPRKRESRFVEFRSFPINSCNFEFLDSHFRGNDAEDCCFPDKFPPSKISLSIQEPKILPFSQKQKFKNRNPKPSAFPRKRESRFVEFRSFPINSCNFAFLDSHFRGNDDGGLLFSRQIPAI